MTRTISILAASAIFILPAAAHAQGAPAAPAVGGGPAAGSTDASRAARDTNAVREDYNRLAGSQNRKKGKKVTAVPAKAEEVVAGKVVSSLKGELLGTVEAVEADGAIVTTAKGKVKIPLEGFGRTDQGLVLAISKEEFEAAVVSAHITKPLS